MAEVASIYQTEEERLFNKPRRQAVPNPALEQDMERYKLKIERKFAESYVNATFKMPRIKTEVLFHANPMNMRFGPVEGDTALILQQRCRSQLDPVPSIPRNY